MVGARSPDRGLIAQTIFSALILAALLSSWDGYSCSIHQNSTAW